MVSSPQIFLLFVPRNSLILWNSMEKCFEDSFCFLRTGLTRAGFVALFLSKDSGQDIHISHAPSSRKTSTETDPAHRNTPRPRWCLYCPFGPSADDAKAFAPVLHCRASLAEDVHQERMDHAMHCHVFCSDSTQICHLSQR